ncbi:hypothetical protein [Scytonema hofmannii]|uniref:hypothetical protein n=1 Tax=Scytonema hofmannii TaxID=34078 RepID=UPI001314C9EA|nr:hypothetical protein [Scytonema hofmannii]
MKRYAESLESFNRALALSPRDRRVLNNRSLILAEWGKHKDLDSLRKNKRFQALLQ